MFDLEIPQDMDGKVLISIFKPNSTIARRTIKYRKITEQEKIEEKIRKMKKRIWIKEGDVVLVAPWDFQYDTRADIVWRYTRNEARWLQEKGYLKVDIS